MRSLLLPPVVFIALLLAAPAVCAEEALPVPLPPDARVVLNLDARDGDLLGAFKTLLSGVNGPVLAALAGAPADAADPAIARLSLADTLRQVHQFRLVALDLRGSSAGPE